MATLGSSADNEQEDRENACFGWLTGCPSGWLAGCRNIMYGLEEDDGVAPGEVPTQEDVEQAAR